MVEHRRFVPQDIGTIAWFRIGRHRDVYHTDNSYTPRGTTTSARTPIPRRGRSSTIVAVAKQDAKPKDMHSTGPGSMTLMSEQALESHMRPLKSKHKKKTRAQLNSMRDNYEISFHSFVISLPKKTISFAKMAPIYSKFSAVLVVVHASLLFVVSFLLSRCQILSSVRKV